MFVSPPDIAELVRLIASPRSYTILITVALLIAAGIGSVNGQALQDAAEPEKSAKTLREEALAAMDAGQDDQAFDLARTAMRVAPEDPQVVFLMALLLADRHRFPEAIKMLDELAEKVPATRLPVLGQTAEWMVKFGWWEQAESRYGTLLTEAPNSALVHRNLGSLRLRQGRRLEAAAHFRKLCVLGDVQESELRPLLLLARPFAGDAEKEMYDPIGTLGIARSEIAIGAWSAARERLESSPNQEPQQVGLLGRIYVHLQDNAALTAWVDQVGDTAMESADYWFAIGSHHRQAENHRQAVVAFCEAVRRDPTDSEAYLALSQSLQQLGADPEAEATQQRAALIQQTQALGAQMAESPNRDYNQVTTLIELLEKLQRPMEALSWRGVRLAYRRTHGALTDAQAQQVLSEIMRDRDLQLKQDQTEATEQFILCGIDLESFKRQES